MQNNVTRSKPTNAKARIPGVIILLSVTIWKIIGFWASIDFIFSLKDGTFTSALQFLSKQGWWIIAVLSLVWIIWGNRISQRQRAIRAEVVIASTFVSFLFGVLLTTYWVDSSPGVFTSWELRAGGCLTTVDTSALTNFSRQDDMVLICGMQDPTIDMNKNRQIARSTWFDITRARDVPIFVPFPGALQSRIIGQQTYTIWHALALIPKQVRDDKISSLNDIKNAGGKILDRPTY